MFKFNNSELSLGMALKFDKCGNRIKTKRKNVSVANSYACGSCIGKTGRLDVFLLILKKVKS